MSLPVTTLPEVPAETARVAHKAFRKGHPWIQLRDELPDLYQNDAFADLYPATGQPAYPPWRLALVSVLQYAEQFHYIGPPPDRIDGYLKKHAITKP